MNSYVEQMYTPLAYGGKIHIENEVILPDYCADISRVVKTELTPKITARNMYSDDNGLNVSLDGTALFKVIYLPEGSDKLHSTFFTESFSHSFKVQADKNSDFENAFCCIELVSESAVCRPSAARRMMIRGDINVLPDIRLNRRIEFFRDQDSEYELLLQKSRLCSMCAQSEADFNISEKINLPRELPPADEILNCDIRYACESLKMTDGKAVFTATAFFTCFYSSQEGDISFCQPIELSQIMELNGAQSSCEGIIRFAPTSLRADIDVDNYGENRVIDVDFSYTAHAAAFTNREFDAASDVFSPSREITPEYGDFNLRCFENCINEKVQILGSLKLKNPDISTIEDIRPTAYIRGWVVENGILTADCRLVLKMIGAHSGGYDGLEESLDFSAHAKLDGLDNAQCDLNLCIREVDCIPTGSSIEVRADGVLMGTAFSQGSLHCLKSLTVGEKKKPVSRPPIILYYPAEKETLWDIAKKYSLPPSLIRSFNGMESDIITDSVIKIPTV